MSNILVTGSNGQLGNEIQVISNSYDYNFFFTCKDDLDITDKIALETIVKKNSIDTIINCAAYTAVDKAELEVKKSDFINNKAVKQIAELAKKYDIKLIHISTDYVFDGENFKPYQEDDAPNPNTIYGKTKLDGEIAMQEVNPRNSIIIRTSWVYSSFGKNFVKTMLKLGKDKDYVGVIFDQIGTPTYARDLAMTILDILPNIKNNEVEVYHYSNEGVLSWFDFAKEIMKIAQLTCKVNPITTKDYPTLANRPHYSLLNKSKIKKAFNVKIPYWKDSLEYCLKIMGEKK